ncbi:MAG: hypothetical protein ABI068_04365 [Ktedonobacterales bacterium]
MRAIDDDTPLKVAVLQKVRQWGPLPESDISRMLKPFMLITDDLREMSEEGLVDMVFIGDEYVISNTTLGKLFLEQEEQEEQEEQPDNAADKK